ncbi:MAG TPA: serine hydrolase, partial [Puia sp.]|nr:serine hydrolase [Puia sp.]
HLRSPLLDKQQGDTVPLTLRQLAENMILLSDNLACDVLLQRIGGTGVVNDFIHGLGIRDIHIACSESQIAADPKKIYDNWCAPAAMNKLLIAFDQGKILSPGSTQLLQHWMATSLPGAHRLKGLLKGNTVVIHKTGTSDTDKTGLTAATNDVGIITLPNGRHLYVSVFLADSRADEPTREKAIALVGRLANDRYAYITKK